MRYVGVGSVRGLTKDALGFKFKDGIAEVSDAQHAACGHVLQQDFSCWPESMAEAEQAKWDARFPPVKVEEPVAAPVEEPAKVEEPVAAPVEESAKKQSKRR